MVDTGRRFRYLEVQRFPFWAEVLILGVGAGIPLTLGLLRPGNPTLPLLLVVGLLCVVLYLVFFRMTTVVSGDRVVVRFGLLPVFSWKFDLDEIERAEVIQYRPVLDYGGWGIRGIPPVCLNARGDRGVLLRLRNGKSMLIGSQTPEELSKSIQQG